MIKFDFYFANAEIAKHAFTDLNRTIQSVVGDFKKEGKAISCKALNEEGGERFLAWCRGYEFGYKSALKSTKKLENDEQCDEM